MNKYPTEEFWNKKFNQKHYFYGEEPNVFLRDNAHIFPQKANILSLGDGEGRNSVYLAEQGFQLTASDASSTGLRKLLALTEKRGVNINTRHEDIVSGNWDQEKWDGIINIYCHLPKVDRLKVYDKIKVSLNKGGIFLTEMFSVSQLELGYKSGGPPIAEMLLSLTEFQENFVDFKVIYGREEEIELDEGRHQGKGHVVRFIAQKI